jgi:amino acid permease
MMVPVAVNSTVATYIPIPGAFTSYAARLIDPSLGFSMGWIYWFNWATMEPTKI